MAGESRKVVTVVFTDVTGSTSLGEQLDPEALRGVMGRYFETAQAVLEKHGGTVEKFIGDAVMAVFGIPQLHEDDALRAVRAAAELRERLAALNEELERERGVRIALRTGVNTGEVVAGDAAGAQFYATGDAVNVAARLEQTAAPDEILVADSTYRLVRDAVSAEPVDSLELRGKAEGVAAWRLLSALDSGPPFVRRLDAPLVGRAEDFARLRDAYERSRDERRAGLCTVIGAPGLGKSRLAGELATRLASEATVLWGRCLSYGEGITFWPLVEILRDVDVGSLLAGLEDGELIEDHVSGLLGERPAANLEETFWAIRKLFEVLAQARPLVVVFDDVHWGEPTFLDLVEHVVEWSQDAAILVVALGRPEFLDERPLWAAQRDEFTLLRLEALSHGEAELLIENLAGEARVPEALRRQVIEASEGNPLFVEQMVAMLSENGSRDGGELAVPATIQALLAARLDQLSADERAVIEPAAVVGKDFWRSAVAELAPSDVQVSASLQRLVRKEFIRPERSRLEGEDRFRFRHVLIRDAAYAAVSKEQRARLHERFAGWLESRYPEFEEIVGYHLEQAHRYRAELGPVDEQGRELGRRAAERLGAAGRRASVRGDLAGAVNLFDRAISLSSEETAARLELMLELGPALDQVGQLDRAETLLAEAIESATRLGNPALEAHARVQHASVRGEHLSYSSVSEAEEVAAEAIPVFEASGDDVGLARAWALRAHRPWAECRWGAVIGPMERALAHARRAGASVDERDILILLGVALYYGPTPVKDALRRLDEIRTGASRDHVLEAGILTLEGGLLAMVGRFEEARDVHEASQELLLDLGQRTRLASWSAQRGEVELLAGEPAAAENALREGCDVLDEMGETGTFSTLAALLAEAVYRQGRLDEAEGISRRSEEATAPDDIASHVGWRSVRAKVLGQRGDHGQAEKLAGEALQLIEQTDALNHHAAALLDRAEVLRLAGRDAEAEPLVEKAVSLLEQKGNIVGAEQARALLSHSRG
jgi:class 3 adenylate cyclase/tetratricopeptide (TPR) repeat protein